MYLIVMKSYIIAVLCFICVTTCYGQKFTKQQIIQNVVNKWWGAVRGSEYNFTISEKSILKRYNRLGFILMKDGTFEIIARSGCGYDYLPPKSGKWQISGDTIIFSAEKNTRLLILKKCDDDYLETLGNIHSRVNTK